MNKQKEKREMKQTFTYSVQTLYLIHIKITYMKEGIIIVGTHP